MTQLRFDFGLPDWEDYSVSPDDEGDARRYADQIIDVESKGDATAKNPRSTATGAGQFVESTWLDLLRRHRPDLVAGRSRQELLDLRNNKDLSKEMTGQYAEENATELRRRGIPVLPETVYLSHFLGAGGASGILKAQPGTPIEALLPEQVINANPFLKGKTNTDVIAWARRKMGGAPEEEADPVQAKFDALDREEPGRYQIISEDDLPAWQEKWKAEHPEPGPLGDFWGTVSEKAAKAIDFANDWLTSRVENERGRLKNGYRPVEAMKDLFAGPYGVSDEDIAKLRDAGILPEPGELNAGVNDFLSALQSAGRVAVPGGLASRSPEGIVRDVGVTADLALRATAAPFIYGIAAFADFLQQNGLPENQADQVERELNAVLESELGRAGEHYAVPEAKPGTSIGVRQAEPATAETARAYSILGVPPDATIGDVKQAYRAKAKALHPDVGGTPEAFADLSWAYQQALKYAQPGPPRFGASEPYEPGATASGAPQSAPESPVQEAPTSGAAAPASPQPAAAPPPPQPEGPLVRAVRSASESLPVRPGAQASVTLDNGSAVPVTVKAVANGWATVEDANGETYNVPVEILASSGRAKMQEAAPIPRPSQARPAQMPVFAAPPAPAGALPRPGPAPAIRLPDQTSGPVIALPDESAGTRAKPMSLEKPGDIAPTGSQQEAGTVESATPASPADDLDIPDFLKRPKAEASPAAATAEPEPPLKTVDQEIEEARPKFDAFIAGKKPIRLLRKAIGVNEGIANRLLGEAVKDGRLVKTKTGYLRKADRDARVARLSGGQAAKKPVTAMLKAAGGVDPGSPLAGELRHMGINPRTAPGLFRKGGRGAVDNFVASEHPLFANDGDERGYIKPEAILGALRDEYAGRPRQLPEQQAAATHAEAEESHARAREDIEEAIKIVGGRKDDEALVKRALEIYAQGHVTPELAVEQAIIRLAEEGSDAETDAQILPPGAGADASGVEGISQSGDEAIGQSVGAEAAVPSVEPSAHGGKAQGEAPLQGEIPGTEPISDADLAKRKAGERLKPKADQKPADQGLFSDDSKQTDLVDRAERRALRGAATFVDLGPFPASGDAPLARQAQDQATAQQPAPPEPKESEAGDTEEAPQIRLASALADHLKSGKAVTAKMLQKEGEAAYGGTMAEGKFTRKDAYDAIELAVNKIIRDDPSLWATGDQGWKAPQQKIAELLDRLPPQTVRSEEQQRFQQFSTPPTYAHAVGYVANVRPGDVVMEPSAGTGSLLAPVMGTPGVTVIANELAPGRLALLRDLVGDKGRVFNENAEQLNNILPADVRPTVVVMNPPFSQTAGRLGDKRDLMVGARHVEQALKRLEPGGRLVAIVGRGMTMGAPKFRDWWKKIGEKYAVRANIGVDGSVYAKYGTKFGTRLLVIDKVPPDGVAPVLSDAQTVSDLMRLLEPIRDVRPAAEQKPGESPSVEVAEGSQAAHKPVAPLHPNAGIVGAGGRRGGGLAGKGKVRSQGAGEPSVRVETGQRPGVAVLEPGRPGRSEGAGGQPPSRSEGGGEPGTGGSVRPERDMGGAEKPSAGAADNTSRLEIEHAKPGSQAQTAEFTDSLYEPYRPQKVTVRGAKPHPSPLVQSAAMASVEPPSATYVPKLPAKIVADGLLSGPQLETVIYAGQAHEQMLPAAEGATPRRRGFFIGDGTGVGKGREIAGIILDNFSRGRTKAVWVSEKKKLMNDAKRDWKGLGQNEKQIFDLGRFRPGERIGAKDGIVFVTYDTLRGGISDQQALARGNFIRKQRVTVDGQPGHISSVIEGKRGEAPSYKVKLDSGETLTVPQNMIAAESQVAVKSRIDQLVEWVGPDFDGVIAFDEAHNMGNAVATKAKRGLKEAAMKALAGLELQRRLPNARIVYVSATGATEVANLAYAERLGLWGRGTAFASRDDFIAKIESGGIAAMELVARDMKQLGLYLARNLSYDGVEYTRLEHTLTPQQREIYDTLAEAWQVVLKNFQAALELTGGKQHSKARSAAYSAFWGAHQRFFNQIITSMQMPSVVRAIEADLAQGRQAVLQLTNTNEASQERAAAKIKRPEDIEELDITPRDQLIQLVEHSFPTQQYEEYIDENGDVKVRSVLDSEGNPVESEEAIQMRDALVERLASVRVPQGPLEIVLDHFGIDTVAEVTGRKRRFVLKPDKEGNVRRMEESRPASANQAEIDAFQAGKKKVLIFSEAGGTGASYHADNDSPSRNARRAHYLVQAGWRADKAVQGFGRTHRTNQASAPIFILVTTDLKGQKRFISSIARRLAQLGALTKGQRQAGDQGIFSARDNLESREANDALLQFYTALYRHQIEGVSIDEFEAQTGLELRVRGKDGAALGLKKELPSITQFLNRLLSLKIDLQNRVFDAFSDLLDNVYEMREAAGQLDAGLETIRADKIEKLSDQVVHRTEGVGAETRYVRLKLSRKFKPTPFSDIAGHPKFAKWLKSPKGKVYAAIEGGGKLDLGTGALIPDYKLISPVSPVRYIERRTVELGKDWSEIDGPEDAKRLWDAETAAAPEFITSDMHLITGAVLPIWDRLKGDPRVVRARTDDGERLIGRVIPAKKIAETLAALGAEAEGTKITPADLYQHLVSGGRAKLANGWVLRRSMVAGEPRIELIGPSSYSEGVEVKKDGVFTERIGYQLRYFVPTDAEEGEKVLAAITKYRPVVEMGEGSAPSGASEEVASSLPREQSLRKEGLPAKIPVLSPLRDRLEPMTSHPDYDAAKAGDYKAAARLIETIVPRQFAEDVGKRFGPDAIYVAPHANEAEGRNAIPQTAAVYLATATGAHYDTEIVQASSAFHTGARPVDRLLGRPVFDGDVKKGGKYVLVDDVTVMGGTLAELADYIRSKGGEVAGIVTLVNRSRSGINSAAKQHVRLIEERYGDIVRQEFGIEPAALTGDEALVILASRDADTLRDRIAKAKQERDQRLRRKGVLPPAPEQAESGLEGFPRLKISPEAQKRLEAKLRSIVRKYVGDVPVELAPTIENSLPAQYRADTERARALSGGAPRTVGGAARIWSTGEALIRIATQDPGFDPFESAAHEAYHVAAAALQTEKEREAIKRGMPQIRALAARQIAEGYRGYDHEAARKIADALPGYEAEAIAAEGYVRLRDAGEPISKTRLPRIVALWFEKLRRLIQAIRRMLSREGIAHWTDVYEDFYQGRMAGRGRRAMPRSFREMTSDLQKRREPFYSGLLRAVEDAKLTKGTAEQWLGTLKNLPGVKSEEMEWLGLEDWLREQEGTITKEQVQDYIRANEIKVQEVVNEENRPWGSRGTSPIFSRFQLPGGENYRELLLTLPPKEGGETFTSGHFAERNVVAHVRFNDRADADGKKTLFIEEIQSDWHQLGRKKGYASRRSALTQAEAARLRELDRKRNLGGIGALSRAEEEEFQALLTKNTRPGVPDAPFKTSWPELALKRMIKWAADNGYDQIAWTPGIVQIERYPEGLRQVATGLSWHADTHGDRFITIEKRGGGTITIQIDKNAIIRAATEGSATAKGKPLEELIGKPMTEQIMAAQSGEIAGKDFTVGGKGMEDFYDKILVNAANKLGKKYGAKVGTTTIDAGRKYAPGSPGAAVGADLKGHAPKEVWSLPITDELREAAIAEGFPLFSDIPAAEARERTWQIFANEPAKRRSSLARAWIGNVQPEMESDRALQADPRFAQYVAARQLLKDGPTERAAAQAKKWDKISDEERLAFMDKVERGDLSGLKPWQQAQAKQFRRILDGAYELEKAYGSTADYVENYMPHLWEKPKEARAFFEDLIKSLGPTWFQKQRTFDLISQGIKAGFKLKTTNPAELVLQRLYASADMVERMKLLRDLRDQYGLAIEGREAPPELVSAGWASINAPDRQRWLLAPDIQPLWKNAIEAKGLWADEGLTGDIFRGWMAFKNVWVPVKLALSAFHPLHVLHISIAEDLTRAIAQTGRGDLLGAAKSLAEMLTEPLSAAIPYVPHRGKKARAAWMKPASKRTPEEQFVVDRMVAGGFVPQLPEQLKIGAKRALQEALARQDWWRLLPTATRRAMEALQAPIFERWIPALKTAAYLNDADAFFRAHPEKLADPIQYRAALRTIAKNIDNRFGEMNYNALFWNRALKDVGIGSFLSLGWNLGFVRGFLGGALEPVGRAFELARGKKPSETRRTIRQASNKVSYALVYSATAMLICALINKWLSGEWPDSWIDFIFPKIGGTNPDGTPRRVTTMFFTREVPMAIKHIEDEGGGIEGTVRGLLDMVWNKMLFQPFVQLLSNRDYFGADIRDPTADIVTQTEQFLAYLLKDQVEPITFSSARRAVKTGGEPSKEIPLALLGFGPAPAYATRTSIENRITAAYRKYVAPERTPRTEADIKEQMREARGRLALARRDGDAEAERQALEDLKQLGGKPYKEPASVYMFARLPASLQADLLEDMSEQERKVYLPRASKKVRADYWKAHHRSQISASQ